MGASSLMYNPRDTIGLTATNSMVGRKGMHEFGKAAVACEESLSEKDIAFGEMAFQLMSVDQRIKGEGDAGFLKQEPEHNNQIHKGDAEITTLTNNIGGEKDMNTFRKVDEDGEDILFKRDVEFGEMVFQQAMAERCISESKNDIHCEEEGAGNCKQKRQLEGGIQGCLRAPPDRGNKQIRGENYREHSSKGRYVDRGNISPMRLAFKRKKKRKRRVVETITRVIHEESEEEGSIFTGDIR